MSKSSAPDPGIPRHRTGPTAAGEDRKMTSTAVKQKPIAGIAVPIVAALTVVGIGIAPRAVKDNPLALLHDVVAFVSTLDIGGGFSPAVASAVALVLFLAGVVSGLSGFAFSAVAACILLRLPPPSADPLNMALLGPNPLRFLWPP